MAEPEMTLQSVSTLDLFGPRLLGYIYTKKRDNGGPIFHTSQLQGIGNFFQFLM